MLAQFVEQGVSHVVMEVSSHALDQRRIQPSKCLMLLSLLTYRAITLDYHQTMEAYAAAKFSLFTGNDENQIAVLNH